MIDTTKFKKLLEEEQEKLVGELKGIARKNPDDPRDWEATEGVVDPEVTDPIDVADSETELTTNMALERPLEKRLQTVEAALARIEDGTYGVCSIGGNDHPIEEARLHANVAARTCIAHLDEEL